MRCLMDYLELNVVVLVGSFSLQMAFARSPSTSPSPPRLYTDWTFTLAVGHMLQTSQETQETSSPFKLLIFCALETI